MGDQIPGASSNAYGAAPTGWPTPPDLATQLEDLIRTVWESEENWRFDDRLDLASGPECGDPGEGGDPSS